MCHVCGVRTWGAECCYCEHQCRSDHLPAARPLACSTNQCPVACPSAHPFLHALHPALLPVPLRAQLKLTAWWLMFFCPPSAFLALLVRHLDGVPGLSKWHMLACLWSWFILGPIAFFSSPPPPALLHTRMSSHWLPYYIYILLWLHYHSLLPPSVVLAPRINLWNVQRDAAYAKYCNLAPRP